MLSEQNMYNVIHRFVLIGFLDKCMSTQCPADSKCVNIDVGAKCVCSQTGEFYSKSQDKCTAGKARLRVKILI